MWVIFETHDRAVGKAMEASGSRLIQGNYSVSEGLSMASVISGD